MRAPALALVVVVALPGLAPAGPQDKVPPPRKEPADSAQKVKDLQKERVATLKHLVDANLALFTSGRLDFNEVADSQMLLLQAVLELAEKGSERIELYKGALEVLKNHEKNAQNRLDAGRGSQSTLLRVKAKRLEIEIALEQEKAKLAKENK